MFATLVSLAVVGSQHILRYMGDPSSPDTHCALFVRDGRLDPPKLSPKTFGDPPQPFQFDWLVEGLGRPPGATGDFSRRFHVYSQQHKDVGDLGFGVARMLMRLWDYNTTGLKVDHSPDINQRTVDVYICWGGTAGGEQLLDEESNAQSGGRYKVNTIYIYDLASFKEPVEMAREVAHEYGHASLPPVGGFRTPEDWGNGVLGEKYYLRYLRNQLAAKKIETIDTMGATIPQLDRWLRENVDPFVDQCAQEGPMFGLIQGEGHAAMDAFSGLVLYMQDILPPDVWRNSLMQMGSYHAGDYGPSVIRACQDKQRVVFSIHEKYKLKSLWIPFPQGARVTGASVSKKKGEWAEIKPQVGAVTLITK